MIAFVHAVLGQTVPPNVYSVSITIPEIVLLVVGAVVTIALLAGLVIILRKDRGNSPRGDSMGDDPVDDEGGE